MRRGFIRYTCRYLTLIWLKIRWIQILQTSSNGTVNIYNRLFRKISNLNAWRDHIHIKSIRMKTFMYLYIDFCFKNCIITSINPVCLFIILFWAYFYLFQKNRPAIIKHLCVCVCFYLFCVNAQHNIVKIGWKKIKYFFNIR